MSRRGPAIVALLCPACGADLSGLDTDAVFGCRHCAEAYQPGPGGLEGPFPLLQSEHRPERALTLPFWSFRLEAMLLPGEAQAPEQISAPAFDLRRRHYFGDPGLRWAMDRVVVSGGPPRSELRGATVTVEDARHLATYSVLALIDKQQDVTGFDLDIQLSEPAVLIVSFEDRGRELVDPVTGVGYPSPAFCDLPSLRLAR